MLAPMQSQHATDRLTASSISHHKCSSNAQKCRATTCCVHKRLLPGRPTCKQGQIDALGDGTKPWSFTYAMSLRAAKKSVVGLWERSAAAGLRPPAGARAAAAMSAAEHAAAAAVRFGGPVNIIKVQSKPSITLAGAGGTDRHCMAERAQAATGRTTSDN